MEIKVKSNPVVAIVGVTGAVGAEFIATMDKRKFPVGKLKALAGARSAGTTLDFRGQKIVVEELTESSFSEGRGAERGADRRTAALGRRDAGVDQYRAAASSSYRRALDRPSSSK